jgi:uncharacterized OsmC-like protein
MADTDLLEPSVDPKTRKLTYRNLTAHNEGGDKTVVSVRDTPDLVIDHPTSRGGTNEGPTPVESVLGGLVGCDAVITHAVAKILKFEYGTIDYTCDAEIDVRGVAGVKGVRPYFETVTVTKTIRTNEPPERIEKLKNNVEQRCPVSNLIRDAGVDLTIDWIVEPL